ncbi:MAG: hypothetical protein KC731_21615 [Myxococcales bacterium]|nr:hypothetical protein [Myxococcales bacterium]
MRLVVAALVFAVSSLLGGAAAAHHILGIPHYKYSEEYPQIPFLEVLAQTPEADVYFTHMPGTPRPGEDVRFKIYATRRPGGEPLTPAMKVEVFRKEFGGGLHAVAAPFSLEAGLGPEANDFKFFMAFAEPEAYVVRVHFPEGGRTEVIDFPVTIGETDDRPLFGGAVGLLFAAVAAVAVMKRRRGSRPRRTVEGGV